MIEVRNLTKRYGQHIAVNNISFKIGDGEIVGFLGPNGAGKTTTMNILTGFISATEGDVIINGFDILDQPEKAKANIGYLPDTPPVYGEMLVKEYLMFVCDIKGVKRDKRQKMIAEIMETVRITDKQNRLIKNLSKGYKQRVGLAQALVGYPSVIIMDEPTVGLDPKQVIEMREVIKKLSKKHTLILSSHILSEIAAVCDRVMIINNGIIMASDTAESLANNLTHGASRISVRIKGGRDAIIKVLDGIEKIDSYKITGSREKETYDVDINGKEELDVRDVVFNALAKNSLPIYMMKSLDLSLEEIFLKIITGETGSEGGNDL